ncbi:ROK family protein [Arthrobacter sp. JSM 101049]|uniref:ROK family protein n=1 Tax=Arthrobacter sp. JSM 101049 TaxID=929097 RepID=UPI00356A7855
MKLGVDIGGTKTAAVILQDDGEVAVLRTAPSGHGPDRVIEVAVRLAREAMAAAGSGATPSSIGACMPGLVDRQTGRVRHAVNLGVDHIDLAARLGGALGRPVCVDNDVKAAALGTHHWLAREGIAPRGNGGTGPQPRHSLAYLNLGTGLAAALVRDGEVLRGPDGSLGEIGHLPMGGEARCGCGQWGCLETLVSGSALERIWPSAGPVRGDPFEAAKEGDRAAAAACAQLCSGLFLAVQMLALTTGADRIVVGGGLTGLGARLQSGLLDEMKRREQASGFVASLHLASRVELLAPNIPVGAMGAALLRPPSLPVPARPPHASEVPA